MTLKTIDSIFARISAGFGKNFAGFYNNYPVTSNTNTQSLSRQMKFQKLPSSLPSGVTGWIPTYVSCLNGSAVEACSMLFAGTSLGTINFATPAFTDGSAYPVRTELGTASVQTWGGLMTEVLTDCNAGIGTATLTYTDQDGNTGATVALDLQSGSIAHSMAIQTAWATGDYGLRDITSVSFGGQSSPVGTVKLWGLTPVATFHSGGSSTSRQSMLDLLGVDFNFLKFPVATEFFMVSFSNYEKSCIAEMYIVGDD